MKKISKYFVLAFLFTVLLFNPISTKAQAQPVYMVGNGTLESCTSNALVNAVNSINVNNGSVYFNCGGAKEIVVNETLFFNNRQGVYLLDGNGLITLSGGGVRRIILHLGGSLTIRNMTFVNGYAIGNGDDASGAAIRSDNNIALDSLPVKLNISNVTFRNNKSLLTGFARPFWPFDYGGAAIYSRSAFLDVTVSTFDGNYASNSSGAAIHSRNSFAYLNGNTFVNNKSDGGGYGGAIHIDGATPNMPGRVPPFGTNGKFEIYNSKFINNYSNNQGGAIFSYLYNDTYRYETLVLDGVLFKGNAVITNTAVDDFLGPRMFGGGLAADGSGGSAVIINRTTFYNNTVGSPSTNFAGSGGGAAISQIDSIYISNSIFDSNKAYGPNRGTMLSTGGGIMVGSGYSNNGWKIENSTITNNYAYYTGGGIQNDMPNGSLTNSIIANNRTDNFVAQKAYQQCLEPFPSGKTNIQFPYDQYPCSYNQTVIDPLLKPISEYSPYVMILEPNLESPAVNAGSPMDFAYDIRNMPRPQDGIFDIGAVEVQRFLGVLESPPFSQHAVENPIVFTGYAVELSPIPGEKSLDIRLVLGTSCGGRVLPSAQSRIARPEILAANQLSSDYDPIGFTLNYSPLPSETTFSVCAVNDKLVSYLLGIRYICPTCSSIFLPYLAK